MGIGERWFIVQTDAVAAVLVDVQVKGDASLAQGAGEKQSVLDFDALIFPGVPDETGWSLRGYMQFVR